MWGVILQEEEHCVLVLREKNCVIIDVKSGWQRKQGTQWLSFVDNVMDLLLCPKINGKAFARNALKM